MNRHDFADAMGAVQVWLDQNPAFDKWSPEQDWCRYTLRITPRRNLRMDSEDERRLYWTLTDAALTVKDHGQVHFGPEGIQVERYTLEVHYTAPVYIARAFRLGWWNWEEPILLCASPNYLWVHDQALEFWGNRGGHYAVQIVSAAREGHEINDVEIHDYLMSNRERNRSDLEVIATANALAPQEHPHLQPLADLGRRILERYRDDKLPIPAWLAADCNQAMAAIEQKEDT